VTQRGTWQGIILLALLATLSWIVARESEEETARPANKLDIRLNFALYDFDGRLLNEDGGIHLQFQAPVLRSSAQNGVSTIESPELTIQQEDDQWYITAESAIISADRENVSLTGDVYLARENELSGELLEVTTRDVMLNITPRTASTDSDVRITHLNSRLDAIGMKIDMISNHFELRKNVRGYYETP